MSDVCVLLLIGLPAAGKTSLASTISVLAHPFSQCVSHQNEHKRKSETWKWFHVCYDELLPNKIEKFTDTDTTENQNDACSEWKRQRCKIVSCVDAAITSILGQEADRCVQAKHHYLHHQLESIDGDIDKFIFVIDDNLFYTSMRYEYYHLARKHGIGFASLYLPCNADLALSRNNSRKHPVSETAILRMANKMEVPDTRQTFENCTVLPNNPALHIDHVLSVVCQAFQSPVHRAIDTTERTAQQQLQCASSLLHRADKALRKAIASRMSRLKDVGTVKDQLKEEAARFNNTRLALLEQIKGGSLHIPDELRYYDPAAVISLDDKLTQYLGRLFDVNMMPSY